MQHHGCCIQISKPFCSEGFFYLADPVASLKIIYCQKTGMIFLTKEKDRHLWKNGYTTGSCAAAAAKGGCLLYKELGNEKNHLISNNQKNWDSSDTENYKDREHRNSEGEDLKEIIPVVDIPLPQGGRLILNTYRAEEELSSSDKRIFRVGILKDGGDDPDITHGLEIQAVVEVHEEEGSVKISGGRGVGIVTKKGLQVPPGESAINPIPRQMIEEAVREVYPRNRVDILIEVPEGEEKAQKTLNPRLGIIGGISILGTTGIVRPMSEEAFKNSILPELDQAKAYGHEAIVLTPGNYGFKGAKSHLEVPEDAIVQMSNFVGFLLEEAAYRQFKKVLIYGHVGKLIKVAGGIFHTHTHVADARMEILLAHGALAGISLDLLRELAELPTIEGMAYELKEKGWEKIFFHLAQRASERAMAHVKGEMEIGTVFTLINGDILAWDENAVKICQEFWTWPK